MNDFQKHKKVNIVTPEQSQASRFPVCMLS